MKTAVNDDWHRPGPTADQRRIDVVIGVCMALGALFNLVMAARTGYLQAAHTPSWTERILWACAFTLPLIPRRRYPATVAFVIAVMFVAAQVRSVPETQIASAALCAALYTLGAWGRDRVVARFLRLGIIAAMFVWLAVAISMALSAGTLIEPTTPRNGPLPPELALITVQVFTNVRFFTFSYGCGKGVWLAARRHHLVEEQAEQLREAQRQVGERAILDERVRIARELHDVVAHHVSVMGVQASAARRVLERDPVKARTALGAVEESARTAVDELRRMLGVLRQPGTTSAAPEPTPASADIDRVEDLIDRVRGAGLAADFAVYGDPVPLPDSVSQTAYRIVQEAVTNALKHAGVATTVDVRVRYLAEEVEIEVTDDGWGGSAIPGSGMGLLGMRERVAVHDGTLDVGPRPGRGYRVRARLPSTGQAVTA